MRKYSSSESSQEENLLGNGKALYYKSKMCLFSGIPHKFSLKFSTLPQFISLQLIAKKVRDYALWQEPEGHSAGV